MGDDASTFLATGLKAAERRRWPEALAAFQKATAAGAGPTATAWLGYCMARERGQHAQGIALCRAAISSGSATPLLHLLLGKTLLLAGDKPAAIDAFRAGMASGGSPELRAELEALGVRRAPPIRRLPRRNPVNRLLGLLASRLHLR